MMKINIEFTGNMEEITKDFSALASILNGMNSTDTAVVLSPNLGPVPDKAPEKEQHPKLDAVPAETPKATENDAPAHETPQHEVPQPAVPEAEKEEPAKTAAQIVPTAPVKEYTLDELLAATAPLMDAGKISELQALMQKFGVPSMMEIPEERYGELATALRELGAEL